MLITANNVEITANNWEMPSTYVEITANSC